MAKFEETKDYTFTNLCNTFQKFKIPNFQRPYSWKNKNIQDFWASIISNGNPYFIGNLVMVKDEGGDLYVVDGQQRLTTISLLLIALRDSVEKLKFKKSDKEKVSRTIKRIDKYLKDDDLSKTVESEYKRLQLGKTSYQDIFEKLVDRIKIDKKDLINSDTQKRLVSNYEILKDLIFEEMAQSGFEKFESILSKVLDLQFIVIVCQSENDIYAIFEGFNSTGLGLSVADLIKNSILKGSVSDIKIQNSIEETWNELEALFEETDIAKFPQFLRHQWISMYGDVRMANLFRRIKEEKIDNKKALEIKEFVELMLDEGKIYLGMIYSKYEKYLDLPRDISDEVVKFRFLQNTQVYEVLLTYYRLYKDNKISSSSLKKILKKMWIFTTRTKFVSVSPSDYEKVFATHCKSLFESSGDDEISPLTDAFFSKLKKLVSSEVQFIDNFISDVQFGKDNKLIVAALSELMSHEDPEINTKSPEIEHILPQEPKQWGLTKSDIKNYVHKIGNLTLLFSDYNKDVSNKKMSDKREVFKKSHFKINQDIDTLWASIFEEDFKKAIDQRSKYLAEKIEKIWRI